MQQGITAVLDQLETQAGQRTRYGAWVDVLRDGQPAGTALVQLTDTDGRVTQYRVVVEAVPVADQARPTAFAAA